MVTSEPSLRHRLPISRPMTPPPITPSLFGRIRQRQRARIVQYPFIVHGCKWQGTRG